MEFPTKLSRIAIALSSDNKKVISSRETMISRVSTAEVAEGKSGL